MKHRTLIYWVLVLGLALPSLPGIASAETYKYVDEKGKVHFTDGLHSVPQRYRRGVERRDIGAPVNGGLGLFGAWNRAESASNNMGSMLRAGINQIRREKNMPPMNARQRLELAEFSDAPLMRLLISSALLTLAALAAGIHGFLQAHPGWAIANLLLLVPVPIYVLLHLANDKVLLKLFLLVATAAPTLVMLKISWDLFGLMRNLIL